MSGRSGPESGEMGAGEERATGGKLDLLHDLLVDGMVSLPLIRGRNSEFRPKEDGGGVDLNRRISTVCIS